MTETLLDDILDKKHGLYQLADRLNWDYLIENFGPYYSPSYGRPSVPIRVIVGLHYIKYLENESDESVVEKFCENPYWQYFCGFNTFQHKFPCHPTALSKWRKKVGIEGVEKLLEETINTAKRMALLPEKLCKKLNIDTTVQEKFIKFPTDSMLLYRMREKLVKQAKKLHIPLRQTYVRVAKKSLIKQAKYRHAGQMKRANRETRFLKTYLRRVLNDFRRKVKNASESTLAMLDLAKRVLIQKKDDKNKVYSLHTTEVNCIAKGKVHKKYEFGCKVSVVTTAKEPWVVSIAAEDGNPYDGHTLKDAVNKAEVMTKVRAESVFVDKGYRGKENHPDDVDVYLSGRKKISFSLKRLLKGRAAIEPIIGHLKSDHRMDRNHLLGSLGDKLNAVLSGCAFNLKKILRLSFMAEPALV